MLPRITSNLRETPMVDKDGKITPPWQKALQLASQDTANLGVPAPNVTAAAVTATYGMWANASAYALGATITLPTDREHLKSIHIQIDGVDGDIGTLYGPWDASPISWTSGYPTFLQDRDPVTRTLTFLCENELGAITETPLTATVDIQESAATDVTGAEGGGRFADNVNRLGYLTVLIYPTLAYDQVPQNVTYYISADDGVTFVWIGWKIFSSVGHFIEVVRLIPGVDETWKVAVVTGAVGGTPEAIVAADLPEGAVVSVGFPILAIQPPLATDITALTVSPGAGGVNPYNVVTPFSQYWSIDAIGYDEVGCLLDPDAFFVRLTAEDLDGSMNSVRAEEPFAGTQVTDGNIQTFGPLMGEYGSGGRTGNIQYVRLRCYVCNRLDQTSYSFQNPAAATLQVTVDVFVGDTPPIINPDQWYTEVIVADHISPDLAHGNQSQLFLVSGTAVTVDNLIYTSGSFAVNDTWTLAVYQDSTGGRPTPTFDTDYTGTGSAAISPDPLTVNTYYFRYDGADWVMIAFQQGASAGTAPSAPNVTISTAAATYSLIGNATAFGFTGTIDLPTLDPDYPHLKRIDIVAYGPTAAQTVPVCSLYSTQFSGTTIDFIGGQIPQAATTESWTLFAWAINDDNIATISPGDYSLSINPAALTSCTADEVAGSQYQDRLNGLHFAVDMSVVVANAQSPVVVTFWLDYDNGDGWIWQGWNTITGGSGTVRVGEPIANTDGVGDIWVPAPGHGNWAVAAAIGAVPRSSTLPSGAVQDTFTVTPVGAASAASLTSATFLINPETGDEMVYALRNPGGWCFAYYGLEVTQPSISADPWYWFCFLAVQDGHVTSGTCSITGGISLQKTAGATSFTASDVGKTIHVASETERTIDTFIDATHVTLSAAVTNGTGQAYEVWNPAADSPDQIPDLYHGTRTADSGQFQGGTTTPGSIVTFVGRLPPDWGVPLANNPDGTPNLDQITRCWLYAVSHANDTMPESGQPALPPVLQATCFGGADHYDLAPAQQQPALDWTETNPNTMGTALGIGSGGKPGVNLAGPLYADVSNNLNIRIGNDFVISGAGTGGDPYKLSQAIINLALATNFDLTNFQLIGGTFFIKSIAVDSLIAGNALFAGTATFAYSGGGKVTISSAGITLADHNTSPTATVTVASSGVTVAKGSSNTQVVSTGVTITDGSATLTLTTAGLTPGISLVKGSNEMYMSASGITIRQTSGGSVNIDSTGVVVSRGNFSVNVGASQVMIAESLGASVVLNSTGVLVTKGTSSVQITASAVTITNGVLTSPVITIAGGAFTINMDTTNGFKVTGNTITTTITNATYGLVPAGVVVANIANSGSMSYGSGGVRGTFNSGASAVSLEVGLSSASLTLRSTSGDSIVFGTGVVATASAGAAALPANPVGFWLVTLNGTSRKVPYYAV